MTELAPNKKEIEVSESDIPLIVDVDGTLLNGDLSVETILRLIADRPAKLPHAVWHWARSGKAGLKQFLASEVSVDVTSIPFNPDIRSIVQTARDQGRDIYLASASDETLVQQIADRLGPFCGHFASDGACNLSGAQKAHRLCATFGEKGFDYAGNSAADLPVWERARKAIVVGNGIAGRARKVGDVEQVVPDAPDIRAYLGALRPHQWLKNVLIFVPMLAAHALAWETLAASLLAFAAFSLCASSAYLLNDLLDLPHDRAHPRKARRPIASGQTPLAHAMLGVPLLLVGAFAIALTALPMAFVGLLLGYLVATLVYSLSLKEVAVVDILTLGGLYTLRVLAGGAATGIAISHWLLAFTMLLFLSLAIVKRLIELVDAGDQGKRDLGGRGYRADDLQVMGQLAGASGYGAVIVLALYITSDQVLQGYAQPEFLWGVCVLLLYWISRVLMIAHRGEMHDDPVLFAATDRVSLGVAGAAGALVLVAA